MTLLMTTESNSSLPMFVGCSAASFAISVPNFLALTLMVKHLCKVWLWKWRRCVLVQDASFEAEFDCDGQSAEGLVTTLDESRHNLEDGDYVTFSEIKGMEELNGCEPRKVTVKGSIIPVSVLYSLIQL